MCLVMISIITYFSLIHLTAIRMKWMFFPVHKF